MPLKQDYSAKVNEQFQFSVDDIQSIDALKEEDGIYHIISNGKSFRAELIQQDLSNKQFTFRIEGELFAVTLADQYDRMIEKMGLNANVQNQATEVKAPMPGLVLEIVVQEGQTVQEGDTLLILEAMKMENVIKSPSEATIASIHTANGDAVEKGSLLISFAS